MLPAEIASGPPGQEETGTQRECVYETNGLVWLNGQLYENRPSAQRPQESIAYNWNVSCRHGFVRGVAKIYRTQGLR